MFTSIVSQRFRFTQDLVLSNLVMVLLMKQSSEYGMPNEVYNDRRIEIDF
ncbi:hypothetical protein [Bacillus mojavensis]|nr:hypothetical protein [Bacillus mojavensis]MEC1751919.1 hypothetical protein [Bacillus mojavensis]